MSTMIMVRMGFLLLGIALFMYSLNAGVEWARWGAIGCLVAALVLRLVDRNRSR